MPDLRFELGAAVMCNMGASGWQLGRIIALHYREDHWPAGRSAPYQVMLEADHALIYVPEDDARYCREATREDARIARRMDALAALPQDPKEKPIASRHPRAVRPTSAAPVTRPDPATRTTAAGAAMAATAAPEAGRAPNSTASTTAARRATSSG